MYLFSVENTVIIVSNAINPSETAPVAKFDKIVNPYLRNGAYQKGIQEKKWQIMIAPSVFYLIKLIYSYINKYIKNKFRLCL
ncbi:MAG TPA: hypothetical protein DIT05_14750 [Morganella sp. (in: Bacteria)]|nr:hypothetical protein [Morganella sp. (in: enterobacteria)]